MSSAEKKPLLMNPEAISRYNTPINLLLFAFRLVINGSGKREQFFIFFTGRNKEKLLFVG
jgi:hypothetical protein